MSWLYNIYLLPPLASINNRFIHKAEIGGIHHQSPHIPSKYILLQHQQRQDSCLILVHLIGLLNYHIRLKHPVPCFIDNEKVQALAHLSFDVLEHVPLKLNSRHIFGNQKFLLHCPQPLLHLHLYRNHMGVST